MKVNLKAARVNAGLTQKQAASLIGVSKDMIGLWERGKNYPSTKYIEKIENAYHIKYDNISFLAANNA